MLRSISAFLEWRHWCPTWPRRGGMRIYSKIREHLMHIARYCIFLCKTTRGRGSIRVQKTKHDDHVFGKGLLEKAAWESSRARPKRFCPSSTPSRGSEWGTEWDPNLGDVGMSPEEPLCKAPFTPGGNLRTQAGPDPVGERIWAVFDKYSLIYSLYVSKSFFF